MIRGMGKVESGKLITIIITLLLFLHPSPFTLHPVYAAESSPSADIRAKLEELKKDIASKAAKIKLEVDRKLKDKVYIGKVKQKSDTNLSLETQNGSKVVNITEDTQFDSNISKKKYSQKSITEEDYIAALGDVDDTSSLIARKIILLPTPTQPKKFLWGQIISIDNKLVTLKGRDLKNIAVSLPNQEAKKLDFVILTGSFGKNDIFEADFVYVIPQGGILKPKKIATSSAKIASPSASPKATLKPTSR